MGPDNVEGYVARWTGVRAGSDGTVEIVVSYDGTVPGDEYKGKYANALALFEEGAGSVKFAAFGDYGYTPSPGLEEVADLVNAHEVDLIITTGDNSYNPSGIDDNVGQFYSDWIGDYQGTYGPGADVNKFFPALGNHDYTDSDATPDNGITEYSEYFPTLPGDGIATSATSNPPYYYDFVVGPVHFFAIDSDDPGIGAPAGSRDPNGTQGQWLQAQLAASDSQWKVVYDHHPPYSSGSHGSTTEMRWPFEEWGATAFLSGHDHTYERVIRDDNNDGVDFAYIVTGAGGKSLYNFGTPVDGSEVRYNADFGSVIATADSDGITFDFYSVETSGTGTLIDTYTIGSTTEPPAPDEWVAYNDLNTTAGGTNPANVTSYDYAGSGALKDYTSGATLPVTVTGSTNRPGGPEVHPSGAPVSNASSDAYAAFNGIVDLTGTDELDDPTWDSTLTFEWLDPAELYAVTLTANRDNPLYDGNRWARVTINGVDASTAASSAGVVVNSPTSISFSVGNNADNGYVAKWIAIDPGSDGAFTVSSEWDDTQGVVPAGTGPTPRATPCRRSASRRTPRSIRLIRWWS